MAEWQKLSSTTWNLDAHRIEIVNGKLISPPLQVEDIGSVGAEAFLAAIRIELGNTDLLMSDDTWVTLRSGIYYTSRIPLRVVVIRPIPTGFEVHGIHEIQELSKPEMSYLYALLSMQMMATSVTSFVGDWK